MKNRKMTVLVLVVVFMLAAVSTVSAKDERIEFTFAQTCNPETVAIEREIFNGQGNYLAKQWTQTCYNQESLPQVNGTVYAVMNLNVVGSHQWPLWSGKARLVTDEGGVWNLNCLYPWPSNSAQCVGQGDGRYEGQQIFYWFYPDYGGSGYIVNHNE